MKNSWNISANQTDILPNLKYMECYMKDSIRRYPSVANFHRQISEQVQLGDYTLPVGASVSVQVYTLHRNGRIRFRPSQDTPVLCKSPFVTDRTTPLVAQSSLFLLLYERGLYPCFVLRTFPHFFLLELKSDRIIAMYLSFLTNRIIFSPIL